MSKYKTISDKIEIITISNPRAKNDLKWINITNADKKEIEYLRRQFGFQMSHLRSSMGKMASQRPMVFQEEAYMFLILHFPALINNRIMAGEIEFFIGHGFLITIHNDNIPAIKDFVSLCKKDQHSLLTYKNVSSAILLAELLDRLVKSCYHLIDEASLNIQEVEHLIFEYQQKMAVQKILNLRRDIINIRKIMQNHKNILQKLSDMKSSVVPVTILKRQYGDLVEHSKRIWEMLDNQKEMIEVLNDTNESLLNNRMTIIMKTLTIFSVIVFPLNLLAAVFGMNAAVMPLVNSPYGFWIIVLFMILGSLGMLAYFKSRKWLN